MYLLCDYLIWTKTDILSIMVYFVGSWHLPVSKRGFSINSHSSDSIQVLFPSLDKFDRRLVSSPGIHKILAKHQDCSAVSLGVGLYYWHDVRLSIMVNENTIDTMTGKATLLIWSWTRPDGSISAPPMLMAYVQPYFPFCLLVPFYRSITAVHFPSIFFYSSRLRETQFHSISKMSGNSIILMNDLKVSEMNSTRKISNFRN